MKTKASIKAWFQRVILRRHWLCFLVMGMSFFAFGLGTLNLVYVFKANADLLVTHGWTALMDGGFVQLLEILLTGYASLGAYIVFKACEYRLAHGLTDSL